jgi:hypothetical protein
MAKQHKLTIADAHLQVIVAALAEKPYRVAQPILQSISVQLQAAEKAEAQIVEKLPDDRPTIDHTGRVVEPEAPNGHDKKAPLI